MLGRERIENVNDLEGCEHSAVIERLHHLVCLRPVVRENSMRALSRLVQCFFAAAFGEPVHPSRDDQQVTCGAVAGFW